MTYKIFEEDEESYIIIHNIKYVLVNSGWHIHSVLFNMEYALILNTDTFSRNRLGLFNLQNKKILLKPSSDYFYNTSEDFDKAFKQMIEIYQNKLNQEKLKQLKEDLCK